MQHSLSEAPTTRAIPMTVELLLQIMSARLICAEVVDGWRIQWEDHEDI